LRWIAFRAQQRGGFNRAVGGGNDQVRTIQHQTATVAGIMNIQPKTWFYCIRHWWLNRDTQGRHRRPQPRSKPVQNPKPFTVFQPIPGQNPKPLFTVHAYSLAQARAIVAAKVAGETIVVGPVSHDGARR
jgi:hypothetical protein